MLTLLGLLLPLLAPALAQVVVGVRVCNQMLPSSDDQCVCSRVLRCRNDDVIGIVITERHGATSGSGRLGTELGRLTKLERLEIASSASNLRASAPAMQIWMTVTLTPREQWAARCRRSSAS